MREHQDFEQAWQLKFADSIEAVAGAEVRRQVMLGSENLSSESSPKKIIDWTRGAMSRLDSLVDKESGKAIMTGCACRYSSSALEPIKKHYQATGDLQAAHQMLQEQFESLLRDRLKLDRELAEDIIGRGWGSAGIIQGNIITATKIPKSGYLLEYLQEKDPQKKRQLYCHCPRVRDALKIGETLSPTYCYCGAGFYQGIWEEILQRPVRVELLESVLQGDDVCKIAIHLPAELVEQASSFDPNE